MFRRIAKNFTSIIKDISGYGRITEKKLKNILKKIHRTLIEADVSLLVVEEIIQKIKISLLGNDINKHLTPDQEFIKILKKTIINIMTIENHQLIFSKNQLSIILVVGLQGSGKTSSVGKLGNFISTQYKKKVLVASTDIYRPAGIQQLEYIAKQAKISFFQHHNLSNPILISNKSVQEAKKKSYEVLILDTAGRLHIDDKMMKQIQNIQKTIQPVETLFVIDSMMGQETINVAKKFRKFLNISGLILTKSDSDARGGSALSASYIIKKPIKFIGTGEKITSFSIFNPNQIASKILGMDDILSIINSIESKNHNNKKKKDIFNKKTFNLDDFKLQIKKIKNISSINNILSKSIIYQNKNIKNSNNKNNIIKIISIINSMTAYEKKNPEIIKSSRKKRISKGSGTTIQDVNKVLKQFNMFKNIMKKIKKSGMKTAIKSLKNIIPNMMKTNIN
ncbi:signal recognition particle protein [Buchnera aphidicola]|uniref:signal recognition particle protein n=1 Tax=Buchnera aphidicola TaxID=9 RepID=UPI0034649700